MEEFKKLIQKLWTTTIGKIIAVILVLAVAAAGLVTLNSCGATARVSVTNRADYTRTNVTMNTNQPTTVTVSTSIDSNKVSRTDTIKNYAPRL